MRFNFTQIEPGLKREREREKVYLFTHIIVVADADGNRNKENILLNKQEGDIHIVHIKLLCM